MAAPSLTTLGGKKSFELASKMAGVPRLISNVIDCPPEQVKIGMAVEVVYEDNQGYTLPKFRPMKRVAASPATTKQPARRYGKALQIVADSDRRV